MSDTDSFITEVSEEVRRDKLYAMMRRYGWIAVVAVIALVGGAAWTEYSRAQDRARAEATGDALLAALEAPDAAARAEALTTVTAGPRSAPVMALMTAAAQQDAGDAVAAVATLNGLAADAAAPRIYRDLAAFKAATLDDGTDPAARRAALETLASPGAPFALLASEQLAILDLAAGDTDAAIAGLTRILQDAAVTQGLRDRAQTLMVALGAPLPADLTQTNP